MDSIVSDSYAVHFKTKAYEELNQHLEKAHYSTLFLLVDENTHEHCLPSFLAEITGDHSIEILEIESGEENKNITTCVGLWEALSELGADRKSAMLNLGGGVLTDMGGFVASTFKRGIDFINIPTTLLAMVDASVGGKTGVDLGSLKNQVGVINQPVMVLIQPNFLDTLAERQVISGFAEMLKHGLIQNATYWEQLKTLNSLTKMKEHILASVQIKNRVVLHDPTEQHLRKILNFGHTLGHAVESYFLEHKERPSLLHGEAIAIGMILEAYLSLRLTALPLHQLEDIKATFLRHFKKINITEEDHKGIMDLLKFDKKNAHGNINFVLLNAIGQPALDVQVPDELIIAAFAYYME